MKNKKGFVLSTYVYILLVFFLLLLGTMLAVLNNTRLLSVKLKEQVQVSSGLIDKDFSFVLLGNNEEVIREGEEYTEPGYKIQTSGGTDLSNNVIIEGSVDTNIVGDYTLTYTSTYNGVTKELTRIVHVLDDNVVNYINGLYQYRDDENGLIKDNTTDENIRYAGTNERVNNYVEFGNDGELWRIIGIFEVSDGTTTEKRVKLVRNNIIGTYSWDSSASDVNGGSGINQWGESTFEDGTVYEGADLMRELNTLYLNQQSGYCCNAQNQGTCDEESGAELCDFSETSTKTKGINLTYREMIDEAIWNTGAISSDKTTLSAKDSYILERGSETGSRYSTLIHTTEWKGKVGLIYPSDYGYASTDENCKSNMREKVNYSCKNDNWLHKKVFYRFLTIKGNLDGYYNNTESFVASASGFSTYGNIFANTNVFPSIYLNTSVIITEGDGTSDNPYKLSLNNN